MRFCHKLIRTVPVIDGMEIAKGIETTAILEGAHCRRFRQNEMQSEALRLPTIEFGKSSESQFIGRRQRKTRLPGTASLTENSTMEWPAIDHGTAYNSSQGQSRNRSSLRDCNE
jgi:hypothetical protein